jgi:glycosyltransferase involved in cell wall biosynthesis
LVIEAFNENWKPLKIATNTKNKLSKKLQKISNSNIEWFFIDDINFVNKLHSEAKAFLFPPEEDFWLVPIAAMATWTPVIAFGKWWALETVVDWKTGIFFEEQSVDSLNKAISKFEEISFDAKDIRKHAEKFDKKVFKEKILAFVSGKLS